MRTVLTLDLGTSATKAGLWVDTTLVALARAPLATSHPAPGRAEQDPDDWWRSVVDACGALRHDVGARYGDVSTLCFSAARETFALVDAELRPLGPGILWSDERAGAEAGTLGDSTELRRETGVVLNGAAHAAKVAWVARHRPDEWRAARWVLAPRDLVVARLTGEVATDKTLASRTGLFALAGGWTTTARERLGARLPEVLASTGIAGPARPAPAEELGIRAGADVVIGAGDRACEVIGAGASPDAPMVSWGTTANVSLPHPGPLSALPSTATVSHGAIRGFLVEAGLSASGAALGWLARLTGHDHDALLEQAAAVEPGARGALALPWLHGARAPWWRPDAHAAFVGLTGAHGRAELARAVVEAVAFDVARCLELLAASPEELALAGAGAASPLWRDVVGGATGRGWTRRRHDDAATVGARLVAAAAVGEDLDVDALNPIVETGEPHPSLVAAYRPIRAASDELARAVLDATGPGTVTVPGPEQLPGTPA